MRNQNGKTLVRKFVTWVVIAILVAIVIELTIADGGLVEKFQKTKVYSANETTVTNKIEE